MSASTHTASSLITTPTSSPITSSIQFPLLVRTQHFHVNRPDTRGFNRIYNSYRGRSYFFELDLPDDHHTIRTKKLKFRLSTLLTHFIKVQKVIPKRIQNKFFTFIRNKPLERIEIINKRARSTIPNNRVTRTFFQFFIQKI